jgi:hypothetical protein
VLVLTINDVYVGKTAITSEFTEKRGERGLLWFGGSLPVPIPGQGPEHDEYVVKLALLNRLPATSGSLLMLADPESLATTDG